MNPDGKPADLSNIGAPTPPAAPRAEQHAAADLLPLIYDDLLRLAQARLARNPAGDSMQPAELVHETFLKLVNRGDPGWQGRAHFMSTAALAMRQLLVDRARYRKTLKRGGNRKRSDWDNVVKPILGPSLDLLAIHEALDKLAAQDARKAKIVNLHCFGGVQLRGVAEMLGISAKTALRDWRSALSYLSSRLNLAVEPD
ncbi:MAG: ECF-type sigma factor [Phycisphaerae bacterium]|nr:ECF-type sigma factor [Phycisphaerae bacterium]